MLIDNVDKEAILELLDLSRETDPTMLDQLIQKFSYSALLLIQEIGQGSLQEPEKLDHAAHKLKGSAGLLGLPSLSQKAHELMVSLRRHENIDLETYTQELTALFHEGLLELNAFISENTH